MHKNKFYLKSFLQSKFFINLLQIKFYLMRHMEISYSMFNLQKLIEKLLRYILFKHLNQCRFFSSLGIFSIYRFLTHYYWCIPEINRSFYYQAVDEIQKYLFVPM